MTSHNDSLFQVRSGYFTAGLVVSDGRVVRAAPIIRWMIGRTLATIQAHCERKQWTLDRVGRAE